MTYDYDLLVIGAGPAGLAASKRAASYGATVAIIEEENIGGTCVNQGCVVEKLLANAAGFACYAKQAQAYGWQRSSSGSFEWSAFIQAKNQEVDRLNKIHIQKLQDCGIQYIIGHAAFADEKTISVNGRLITAKKILIASGSKSAKPNLPGIDYAISSKDMFNLAVQPKELVILGNNYIAVKAAQTLNALGTKVTMIFPESDILHQFDEDLFQRIQISMVKNGIQLFPNTKLTSLELRADCLQLNLDGFAQNTLLAGCVLSVTKRVPAIEHLKLDRAGIKLNGKGQIIVDDYYCTNKEQIFSIGDCNDWGHDLTPVATAEGNAFADIHFAGRPTKVEHELVPIALSFWPEAASVGLSEKDARLKLKDPVKTSRKEFSSLFYNFTGGGERSFIKLVLNSLTDRVLGIHMIGDGANEIVQSLGLALKVGVSKSDFEKTLGIHPSQGEEFFSL